MNYFSVCSGIEAASCAWQSLGWKAVAFSEVDPFPCRVLAHHFPDVPNLGDMTKIDGGNYHGSVDILVGGTPCQDFSIAGKKAGLDGERSGLVRDFVRLLREIRPKWFVWENVPGVLSTHSGRDFGKFIWALDSIGYGLAWRVLDARFFGVPQRRRRVFLVGYFGDVKPAGSVLFEPDCLCWDTKKGKKTKENSSGENEPSLASGSSIARCLTAHGHRLDYKTEDFVIHTDFNITDKKYRIRRLTPLEYERLMGFPDGWTSIPGASDTARYKALGNSMAVPVMRWIGSRIEKYNYEEKRR